MPQDPLEYPDMAVRTIITISGFKITVSIEVLR